MLKNLTVQMVAVYAHGISFKNRPLCYIPAEEAQWWKDNGSAVGCCRGKAIQLAKATLDAIRGTSAKMGPAVIEGNADGQSYYTRMVNAYRDFSRASLASITVQSA